MKRSTQAAEETSMREEQKRKKDRRQAYKRNAAREFGEM